MNKNFIDFLKDRLKKELPGLEAHVGMAPLVDNKPFRSFEHEKDSHASSVLALLFPGSVNNSYEIVLTLRSKKLNSHSGQISFPGGHSDPGESVVDTAFREAEEEIALNRDGIEVLGFLSQLFVPPSKSLITPVVAWLPRKPEYKVNSPDEVEEVFSVSLDELCNVNNFKREIWEFKGRDVDVPMWDIHPNTPLWGATSMILNELLFLYRELLVQNTGN